MCIRDSSQTEKDLRENPRIPELTERMKETESGITNITNAIEKGIASDALMNRLVELEKEKKNLLRLLAEEEKDVCKIERNQIVYWLTEFKGGRIEDERYPVSYTHLRSSRKMSFSHTLQSMG